MNLTSRKIQLVNIPVKIIKYKLDHYVSMVDGKVNAQIAEEVHFVSMVDGKVYAKITEEVQFVSMVDGKVNAQLAFWKNYSP